MVKKNYFVIQKFQKLTASRCDFKFELLPLTQESNSLSEGHSLHFTLSLDLFIDCVFTSKYSNKNELMEFPLTFQKEHWFCKSDEEYVCINYDD